MLIRVLIQIYDSLLRLYPQSFRTEFEEEMQAVFTERINDAAQRRQIVLISLWLCEIRHLLLDLLLEHRAVLRTRRNSLSSQSGNMGHPGVPILIANYNSWPQTLLVGIPILLIGLGSIFATYLPYDSWQVLFGVVLIVVLVGVLGLAWVKGFPRWSCLYVIPMGGVTLMGTFMTAITGEMLNLVVPVAILGMIAAAIWMAGAEYPLRQMVRGVWQDWTLLAFGMYGLLGVAPSLIFDDAHYNNQTPYYAIAVIAGVTGGLLFLRSGRAWQRMASLLIAATSVVLMGALDQAHFIEVGSITYQSHGWMVSVWILTVFVIAGPALLMAVVRHMVLRGCIL